MAQALRDRRAIHPLEIEHRGRGKKGLADDRLHNYAEYPCELIVSQVGSSAFFDYLPYKQYYLPPISDRIFVIWEFYFKILSEEEYTQWNSQDMSIRARFSNI